MSNVLHAVQVKIKNCDARVEVTPEGLILLKVDDGALGMELAMWDGEAKALAKALKKVLKALDRYDNTNWGEHLK